MKLIVFFFYENMARLLLKKKQRIFVEMEIKQHAKKRDKNPTSLKKKKKKDENPIKHSSYLYWTRS